MITKKDLIIKENGVEVSIKHYCFIKKEMITFTLTAGDYQHLKNQGGYSKMYNHKHKLS